MIDRPRRTRLATSVAIIVVLFAAILGCDDGYSAAATCQGIEVPTNGCPVYIGLDGEDDTCSDDGCCAAAYTCDGTAWSLAHSCPGYDNGKGCPDAATTVSSQDAGVCDASGIDAPAGSNGGFRCIDLELPDCPLGEVLTCGQASCIELGCGELFYCQNEEWIPWGECTEDGGIRETN